MVARGVVLVLVLCVCIFFLRISKGLRTQNSNVLYVREVNEDPAITLFSTVERDRRVREKGPYIDAASSSALCISCYLSIQRIIHDFEP